MAPDVAAWILVRYAARQSPHRRRVVPHIQHNFNLLSCRCPATITTVLLFLCSSGWVTIQQIAESTHNKQLKVCIKILQKYEANSWAKACATSSDYKQ